MKVTFTGSDASLFLVVEDDGKGCPNDAEDGVGSQLVRLLVRQLDGEVTRTSLDKGCRVTVIIPKSSIQH